MTFSQRALQFALGDRYRVERELGRGGMAIVYLAEEIKHGRKVALKILRPEVAASVGTPRFLREIRIAAQLNHPNILTLIDSGECSTAEHAADGATSFLYYVMPYVEGESLRARLAKDTQLPIGDALQITRDVADALSYAHSHGVIHRDIKPENILLESGRAVVTDFGVASAIDEAGAEKLTETGLAVGTPAYMSPEQASGSGNVDARSDVYSLGCVLYEMLAGTPPYMGATPQAILARKALEPVPSLRIVRELVPAHVERAIARALAKVPADRFSSAREFADALAGEGQAHVSVARSRDSRWLVAAAALGLLVVAASFLTYWRSRGSADPDATTHARHAQLSSDPGAEWFPSLSPDGKWVVYSGEASGNRDIYLLSVGGQNAINLTRDSREDEDQPTISPDGERIAFRSEREGGGIFVMGRTGEALTRVTRFGYKPSWSPEGTHLAFVSENVVLNPQNSDNLSQLWVADVKSGDTRRLDVKDAVQPSWSPNGYRIAYTMRLGEPAQGDIWTVPAAGGAPVPVTADAATDWNPAWSPDGKYVYFVSNRGGSMNLWRVAIDEQSGRTLGMPQPITTPATSLAHISLSADGTRIAYASVIAAANLQRLRFDPIEGKVAGEPEWITRGTRRWSSPDPSADGESVTFYSLVQPEGHLYVMRSDGSGMRQITGDTLKDRVPRWSPDGRWISFFSNRSGVLQLWEMRPDGSEMQQLTDSAENGVGVWSPDGSRLAVSTLGPLGFAYIIEASGEQRSRTREVLPVPPRALVPFTANSWSPDGKRLAGTIAYGDSGIVIYTMDAHRYDRLTTFGQWPVWLPDSRRVLFVSGERSFFVVDIVTREVQPVFSVPRDVIGPPRLTRDGEMMYYSRRATESDVWLLTLQ